MDVMPQKQECRNIF